MVSAHPVWFVISGAFFLVSVLLNVVLIVVALRIGKRVDGVMDEVKRVSGRLGEKAVGVANSAESIALTAQRTVTDVRGRALELFTRAEEDSGRVGARLAAAGAALTTVVLAVRIAGAVRGILGPPAPPRLRAVRTNRMP